MTLCNLNPHIEAWLGEVEQGKTETCKEQKQLARHVRKCFKGEDIYTDGDLLERYLGLVKYFPFDQLFPWEEFCIALHLTTFWKDSGLPRWPDLFLLIGRGAGKDGFIAVESLCVISPYSKLRRYDVDICANNEEQAMRPLNDLLDVMDDTRFTSKLRKYFYWTKEKLEGRQTRGTVKGRTNNPKSRDGMRSGMVVFNEIHQYENYKNIKVFVSGQGKTSHPRRLYATTDGDVRDGPLDDLKARSKAILDGSEPDGGLLPFICRLDDKKEATNPKMWVKANPSLPYLPSLQVTIEKEFAEWQQNPTANADFMTKRMNLPQSDADVAVTMWENVAATNRPAPDVLGMRCVCGIDYASISDFASVNLHFLIGEERIDINHSWLCLQSRELHRINREWRVWADQGLITPVDDVQIHPDLLCEWIFDAAQKYQIQRIAVDNFRYALLANSLKNIGFEAENKTMHMVRPSDIMRVQPVIDSVFANQNFTWGNNPVLRWATNNTKLVRKATGNFYYDKIEPKSRKTDPFMALVHSMVIEGDLDAGKSSFDDLPVIIG